jgi:hypothetical protein
MGTAPPDAIFLDSIIRAVYKYAYFPIRKTDKEDSP